MYFCGLLNIDKLLILMWRFSKMKISDDALDLLNHRVRCGKDLICQLDKLRQSGNLPGVGRVLLENYDLFRSLVMELPDLGAVNEWVSRTEEQVNRRLDKIERFERDKEYYLFLNSCAWFYGSWCGSRAIGHWCGVPSCTESDLLALHQEMADRFPEFYPKGELF